MTIFGGFITGGTVSTDPGDATKLTFSGIVINGAGGAVAGDTFSAGGYQVKIASVDGTGAATLVYAFPVALDGEADYAIARDSAERYNPAATNLLVRQYLAKIADASITYVVPDDGDGPTDLIAPDPQEGQKAIQFGTQWKVWLFTGGVWELQNGYVGGSGIKVDASGDLADRDDFDGEDPGFTYFGSDTNLLYVRLNAGGWSSGSQIIGLDGAPGAQGEPGERGPAGPTTIAVGSVTTLAPGESATVTNSGDEEDAVFDFGIPAGEKGDKGDTGDTGPQGPQGEKGDKGDTGDQGPPGRDGTGAGDMVAAVYDPNNVADNAFSQDNMSDGLVNKNFTATEKTKLEGIEAGAKTGDVTGPSSSAAGNFAAFSLTTGKALADSGKGPSDFVEPSDLGSAAFESASSFATSAQGTNADSALQSVVAGANVSVDSTDPRNPIVSAAGGDDPWAQQPIGVPIPLLDNIVGVAQPPTDQSYRYIKLTASDSYNTGVLTSESVTGTVPLVVATAVISLSGSPINGQTVSLINTERRFLRAGSAGTVENDQMQQITGSFVTNLHASTTVPFLSGQDGAFTSGPSKNSNVTSNAAGASIPDGVIFNSANSPGARAGTETRGKNIGVTFFMRIK